MYQKFHTYAQQLTEAWLGSRNVMHSIHEISDYLKMSCIVYVRNYRLRQVCWWHGFSKTHPIAKKQQTKMASNLTILSVQYYCLYAGPAHPPNPISSAGGPQEGYSSARYV